MNATQIVLMAMAALTASSVAAQCTPAAINPSAVQRIQPHMSPAAVSSVLGCAPSSVPATVVGSWTWDLPGIIARAQGLEYAKVVVAVDEAGVVFAGYTFAPLVVGMPAGNSALRVEPPTLPWGIWVPGAYAAP